MSVELLFDKHALEYSRFDRIVENDRLHADRAKCALLYILKLSKDLSGEKMEFKGYGEGAFLSHPDLNLDELTEFDVIYLLRCGMKYDRENDCLLYRY